LTPSLIGKDPPEVLKRHFLSAYAGFAVVFRTAHRHAPNVPKAKSAANRGQTAQNGAFGKSNRVQPTLLRKRLSLANCRQCNVNHL
jgi:hypothetical protein